VSELLSMNKKIDEYINKNIKDNLYKLKSICPYYREIRGDGNCFYRAIIFYYFECILSDPN